MGFFFFFFFFFFFSILELVAGVHTGGYEISTKRSCFLKSRGLEQLGGCFIVKTVRDGMKNATENREFIKEAVIDIHF